MIIWGHSTPQPVTAEEGHCWTGQQTTIFFYSPYYHNHYNHSQANIHTNQSDIVASTKHAKVNVGKENVETIQKHCKCY